MSPLLVIHKRLDVEGAIPDEEAFITVMAALTLACHLDCAEAWLAATHYMRMDVAGVSYVMVAAALF